MSAPDPARLRALEERLRAVEARTGVQVVVATVDRADAYHGLRWRAYAFGSALGGAGVAVGGAAAAPANPGAAALLAVTTALGAGLAFALAATLLPGFGRLFLEPGRAELELRRRAESLFLERELFATRGRRALLLLAGVFERRAVVVPDAGLWGRVAPDEWEAIGAAAAARRRDGGDAEALAAGLEAVERLLVAKGFEPAAGAANELPDAPVVGRGA